MLNDLLRLVRRLAWVVGVALCAFAVIELLRAWKDLHQLHPAAGWGFVAVVGGGLVLLLAWYLSTMIRHPRTLKAPPRPDDGETSPAPLRRWAAYLARYLRRLKHNPRLSDEARAKVDHGLKLIDDTRRGNGLADTWRETLGRVETESITPALAELDEVAEREVRVCTSSVMLGVTLSPYNAMDLMIVVYRNLVMIGRLVRIYHSRPRLGEQLRILRDTISVVATVNFVHLGKGLIEGLLKSVPGGVFVDDIAQGIGAGFMTSAAGHAAIDRCRCYTRWSTDAEAERLRSRMTDFYRDVRDIFFKDVWPQVQGRFGQGWRSVRDGVAAGLNSVGKTLNDWVARPAREAGSAAAGGSKSFFRSLGDTFRGSGGE